MNATLTNDVRHEQSTYVQHPQQVRRVGLADRAALHLGVALIKWGRRPVSSAPQLERRANRLERALAAQAREQRATAHREAVQHDYAMQLRIR
jgi:hypothetical protein